MPTAEVKRCMVSVYHLAPQISEAFTVFLVAGGNCYKATSPDPSVLLCSVSLYQRVFYALASWCPSQRTRDSSKTPRPNSLCPKVSNINLKLLSPNHLRSLPAAPYSDLSARQYKGVIPGYDVRTFVPYFLNPPPTGGGGSFLNFFEFFFSQNESPSPLLIKNKINKNKIIRMNNYKN